MAPRATTKKSRVLVFETTNRKAVCSAGIERARDSTAEVVGTGVSDIYRTTPVVTDDAHNAERTIAAFAVTGNGKLQG